MLTVLIASAVLFAPVVQDTQAFSDPQLGLSFNRPSTWIVDKTAPASKAKKKKKGEADPAHFKIPITGSSDDADLVIMRAGFSGSPDDWQKVQVDANKNLKRDIDRQWQQEVLGVPLLLTRINYSENGTSKTTLTGLLYNDAESKLLFRLTGPAGDFDKAQGEFMTAMESLRTTDNTLPKAQEPGKDPSKKNAAKVDQHELKHPLFMPQGPPKPKLAPVAVPLVVSTKKVELRVPEGWSASQVDGATFTLKNSALPYPLKVKVATSLDSDPPQTALIKASADSLALFDNVERREDDPINSNQGGCVVAAIWRRGAGGKGKVASFEAAGVAGEFYFVMTGTPAYTLPEFTAQRKVIRALLDRIGIEATP